MWHPDDLDDLDGMLSPAGRRALTEHSAGNGSTAHARRDLHHGVDHTEALADLTARIARLERKTKSNFDALAEAVGDELGIQVRALEGRIEELETRGSPELQWRGVWRDGMRAEKGNLITDRGSLWLCIDTADDRPGTSDAFKLIVKSGSYSDGERRRQTATRGGPHGSRA
jgi:hypothetical protein